MHIVFVKKFLRIELLCNCYHLLEFALQSPKNNGICMLFLLKRKILRIELLYNCYHLIEFALTLCHSMDSPLSFLSYGEFHLT